MANTKLLSRIVLYTLTATDAIKIKRHRELHLNFGLGTHFNEAKEGDVLPMIVVAGTDGDDAVNGQIFCDGVDRHWVTSVKEGEGVGTFVVYKPGAPVPTPVAATGSMQTSGLAASGTLQNGATGPAQQDTGAANATSDAAKPAAIQGGTNGA